MADTGINIRIRGDSGEFTQAALDAAKASERTAKEVQEEFKRAAEAQRAAYRTAADAAKKSSDEQRAAAQAVSRLEAERTAAIRRATTERTREAIQAARAKAMELEAARRVEREAARAAKAARDAAAAQGETMRRSTRDAIMAEDAYRRAREAAERLRAAEAARWGGGAGGPPPAGGGPPPPGGGPPPPRRGGRGGGPPPPPPGGGGNAGNDLNTAYQILQDLIQGGPAAIANQLPQLLDLLKRHGLSLARILGKAGTALSAGITIGHAIADPQWAKDKLTAFSKKLEALTGAIADPEKTAKVFAEWLAEFTSGARSMRKASEAMGEKLEAFNRRRDLEMSRRAGEADSQNAENRAEAQRAGIRDREETAARNEAVGDLNTELEKARLEGIRDEEKRAAALAELEKRAAAARAQIRLRAAGMELELAAKNKAEADLELKALDEREKKAALAVGASGTSPALERIRASRQGVEARAKAAGDAVRDAGQGLTGARNEMADLSLRGRIIDQKLANDKAEDEAKKQKKAAEDGVKALEWLRKGISDFAKDIREKSKEISAARLGTDTALKVAELRARGRNREADKVEKDATVRKRADELVKGEDRTPKKAREIAEREFDARDPRRQRRIRGAGYQGGPDGGGRSSGGPDFTGPGGVTYDRSDRTAPMPGDERRKAPDWSGLDAYDELQKKNRKIRGAGFQGPAPMKSVLETAGKVAVNGIAGPGSGAALGAILGAINGVSRKLDGMQPSRQPIRR